MKPLKYVAAAALVCVSAMAQSGSLKLTVLEGSNVEVSTRDRRGADIRVRVTDGNDNPVDNATVTAVLPAIGAGGSFGFTGETIRSKTTGSNGEAEFSGIRIRPVSGEIPVRLVARSGNLTASAIASQTASEVSSLPQPRFSKRRIAMLSIVGAGVAAGVTAWMIGGNTPDQPAFNATPGIPSVTGPR